MPTRILTNSLAIAITSAAWVIGVIGGHMAIAWTIVVITWVAMKLTKQVEGYPFDWAINLIRGR
ncbi:hypothetical protein [Halomonas sp. RT37]|uniref:DUF4870 domain-containing protein n=1 Tax=Halomonas sp. RT37 TaxID=2950872 RepID=A0AAU7KCT3_9GAMM